MKTIGAGSRAQAAPGFFQPSLNHLSPLDNWKNYSLNVTGLMLATYLNRLLNEANIFIALLTEEE